LNLEKVGLFVLIAILVMMNSNGKAMCMKSSTAEKLIYRGIVVPA